MHGIIFSELQKYTQARIGRTGWDALQKKAGLGAKLYMSVEQYPDADMTALVSAASAVTGHPVSAILEDFGEFITPSLMGMYGHLLKPLWKTLDVIQFTEGTIHAVVRVQNRGAEPPNLRTMRTGPNEVIVIYDSPRQMCALAKGIGKGLARHFREVLTITEPRCMHWGSPSCEIHFCCGG